MAIQTAVNKVNANVSLNIGTSGGDTVLRKVSLGTMTVTATTDEAAQKMMNITNLLSEVLAYPVYSLERTITQLITEAA